MRILIIREVLRSEMKKVDQWEPTIKTLTNTSLRPHDMKKAAAMKMQCSDTFVYHYTN